MEHSKDYHDYVFKDGRLVGDFEGMYRHSSDIPWHQDETSRSVFSDIDIAVLKQHSYDSICEVGCGMGYFTDRLRKELCSTNDGQRPRVTGLDVSETAVRRAGELFPECRFAAADALVERPLKGECFDLVVVKEVLWYVTDGLDRFLVNLSDMVKKDGFLYVSQSFPEEKQWVGQDVIGSPDDLMTILSKKVDIAYHCIEWDSNCAGRPLAHVLGKKR
jgi:SAM-dependent methyltransferase